MPGLGRAVHGANHRLARGDNVPAALGSNSLEWNPADTGNCPNPSEPQSAHPGLVGSPRRMTRLGTSLDHSKSLRHETSDGFPL